MSDSHAVPPAKASFPTTHWSRIVAAADPADPQTREALAELCAAYWYPLYAYVRRKGYGPDEAADLVQGTFAALLARDGLGRVDPARGRFRAFLMTACTHHIADCHDRDQAVKRGGGRVPISINRREAEDRYAAAPAHRDTPERLFERDWALALIDRAFARLERHYAQTGRAEAFRRLRPLVTAEPDAATYASLAAELGASEASLRVAAHRLRARFAAALRDEIAAILDDPTPEAIDAELRDLFAAVGP